VLGGSGVELLRKVAQESAEVVNRVESLRNEGVKINVYASVLEGEKIALDDPLFEEEADIIPSGVAEICKLQQKSLSILDHEK
tara:strand:+ start:4626 stop:4874 length:249 start_codon:yes stop_codon:yes gene_type:complete